MGYRECEMRDGGMRAGYGDELVMVGGVVYDKHEGDWEMLAGV